MQVLSGKKRIEPAGIVDFVPVGYDIELLEASWGIQLPILPPPYNSPAGYHVC
jgi:hypothetical protein